MNPAVVAGLGKIVEAPCRMQWLDTVSHPKVAAAWLSASRALAGGTMIAALSRKQVR